MAKKLIIIFGILIFAVIGGNAGGNSWFGTGSILSLNINAGGTSWSGTGIMLVRISNHNSWRISANAVNARGSRNIRLNYDNLEALHVRNKNSEGTVTLQLIQGNIKKDIDITGEFDENIDTSDFEVGNVRIHIIFENARNVDFAVSW